MLLLMLSLFLANLFWGAVHIPLSEVVEILFGSDSMNGSSRIIVLETRVPQAVTAMLCGMALSVAGVILQTLFNNPLAGPEVLGINSGAGLGVAVVMLLMQGSFTAGTMSVGGYVAVLMGAFTGALLIIVMVMGISTLVRSNVFLLIAGLSVSYLASAVVSLLNYFSTAEGVHSYLIWGMGSFSAVSKEQLPLFAVLIGVALLVSLFMMKPLNALLLGDVYAANLGIRVKCVRTILLVATGFLTAVCTAYCGPISFIGLAVPHFARLFLRSNNHRILLPAVMLMGGIVALLCNILTRLPGESGLLPLGAITPLIGAPVILYVVLGSRENGDW